jgi:hypothetical protein
MVYPKDPDSAGIEVVHELPNDLHSSFNIGTRAELDGHFVGNGVDPSVVAPPASSPAQEKLHRLKRTVIWLVVATVLLIVVAVVLGAVLGTKLKSKSAAPTATPVSSPTATASPTPSSIRKNTAISVTGWRSGSEFSIRLFYQGDDAYLRIIGLESINSSWSAPSTIVQAKPGTPIAASSYNNEAFFGGSTVWNLAFGALKLSHLLTQFY